MSIITPENRELLQSLLPYWDGVEENLGESFQLFRETHPETEWLADIERLKQFAAFENARQSARHLARLEAGNTAQPSAKLAEPEPAEQFVSATFDHYFPRENEGPLGEALFAALPFSHPMVFLIVDGTRKYKAIALPLEPLTMRNTGFVIELAIERAPGEWVMDFRTDNGDQKVRPAVVAALTNPGPAILTGEVATYLVRELRGAAPFANLLGEGQTVGGKYQSTGTIKVEGNKIATRITTHGAQLPPLFVSIPSYPSFGPKLLTRAWFESFPDDDPRVYFGTQKDGSFKRYLMVTGLHEELATQASTLITYDDDGCLCIFSGISDFKNTPHKTNQDGKKIWLRKPTIELEDNIKDLASRILSSEPHVYVEGDRGAVAQATLRSTVQGRTITNTVVMTGPPGTLRGTFTYEIPLPEKPFDLNPVTNPIKFGTREWFVQYTANPFNQNVFTNGEWQFVVLENKSDGDLLIITMMPDGQLYMRTLINSSPDPAVNRPETIALIRQALATRGQELGQVPTKRLVKVEGRRRAIALFDAAGTTHNLGMAPLEDGFSQSDAQGNKLTLHLQDTGVVIKSANPKGEPLSHVKFELPGYTAASPQPGSKKTAPATTLPLNEGPITASLLNNIPDSHPMAFKISDAEGKTHRALLAIPIEGMDMRFGFFIEGRKGTWSFRVMSFYAGTIEHAALCSLFISADKKILQGNLAAFILGAVSTSLSSMIRRQGNRDADHDLGISTHFIIRGSEVQITATGPDRPKKITRFVIPAYNAFDPDAHPISTPGRDEPPPEPVTSLPAPTREEPMLDTSSLQQALERLQSTRPSVAKIKLDDLQNKSPLNVEVTATAKPLPIAIKIKPSNKKTKDVFGFLQQGGEGHKGTVEIKWGADSDEIAYEVTGQKGKMHLDSNGMGLLRPVGPRNDIPHGTASFFYENKEIYLSVTEGTKLFEWLDLGLFGPRLDVTWHEKDGSFAINVVCHREETVVDGRRGDLKHPDEPEGLLRRFAPRNDTEWIHFKTQIANALQNLSPTVIEDQDGSWQATIELKPNSAEDLQKMSGILAHVAKIYSASIGQARTVQYKKPPPDFHWEEWEEKIEVPMRTAVGLSPQAITLKGKTKIHNESGEILEKTLGAIEYGTTKNLRKNLKSLPGTVEIVQVIDGQTTERFDLEITGKIVANISNYAVLWEKIIPITQRQTHDLPAAMVVMQGKTLVDAAGTVTALLTALTYGGENIPLPPTINFPLAIPIKSKTNADNPGWENFLLNVQVENGRVVASIAEYVFTSERDVTTTVTLKPRFADAEDHLDPLELELTIQSHPEMGRILTDAKVHHPLPNPPPSRGRETTLFPPSFIGEKLTSPSLEGRGLGGGWNLCEGSTLKFSLPDLGTITYTLTNAEGDPKNIRATRDPIELVWETKITADSAMLEGMSSTDQVYAIPLEVREHAGEKRYFVPAEKISFLEKLHLLAGQPWHYDPQKHNALEVVTSNGKLLELAPLTITNGDLPVRAIPFADIRVLRDLTNPAKVVGAHSDIDVALGTREATAHGAEFLQFQEGEVFTPTATTIKMLMDHIVTTDHGPVFNFVNNAHYEYELEAKGTGIILVLPVRWSTDRASRLAGDDGSEGDPTNRPSNPFVLRMGEPILFYRVGETRASAQPLQAAGLRVHDQGGAWTIYHLGSRYADQQVGPRGEKGFTDWRLSALVSRINPTFIGMVNLIGPDGSMDETANYRRDAKEQIEAEVIRHLTRSPDELPVLEYDRSRIRAVKGKPHELIFYAEGGEAHWARITGISVIVDGGYLRLNDDLTLSFGTGEVTDENVTEKFSIAAMNPADPADKTQVIMRVVDENTRIPLFRMDLRSGRLMAMPAGQDVPVLPAVDFAETLKRKNFPVLDEKKRQTYQRKTQAPDPKGVVRVDENINPLPRELMGFDYPAVIHTATDPAHSAQLVASLAGHIFLPVEKTLFDQLLIGRTQETMIFMATNGALLEIPMLLAKDGSRYMADREANPVWSLQGTRLLIPDPQKPGEYFDLAAPFHAKAGPQSTTLELNVGEGQNPLNLKQILTAKTLNGTGGRRAFGFYPVFENTQHELLSGQLMRRLNELVEYHYLDDPKQALQIASMDATSGTIRLQNGVELHAHIAPMPDGSHELHGVEFAPDAKVYTADLEHAYNLFIPEDGGALYFLTDPSGKPLASDAEDAGQVLRFIIQKNGIPLFFKRRPGIKHFIDAPETREFEMVDNEGKHYPGGATSSARLIALHDAGAKGQLFEVRAALGRWEGATGSGLKYLGREAQVRFQVERLENGVISVRPEGFIKEEATGGAREKEKTFKPADVEMIPRFNGMVRVIVREQDNPGNYAMMEFASPAHLTDPQKFAVHLAHYNRRNARLNKMPSEEGFLDAALRFESLDIGLMHFLDAVIPADEKNSLGKITGCYADYALLQGVLETIGFHEGHAHWPLAMRSLLEVARGGELPTWDEATDLEALRTKYNLPPEKKPEQSLRILLQDYKLWDDLPESVQALVADGKMTTLEDLIDFYDSLDAGDEKKLIREQTASLHLVLTAQKMAHAENVLAIAESRNLYPPSEIIIKKIMERVDDFVDETLSLQADIEELNEHLKWDRSFLATLYLVFARDEALGFDLITQLKKIMPSNTTQAMKANNLSRHVLALALSHAELLPPLVQLFSRFMAKDLYLAHFVSITAMMKALAHFEERTAANMVEQLHTSEVTDSDILDFIFVFSQLGNLPHEKRDAAIKSVAPYFAKHFGKPWPRQGSARTKKLFEAKALLNFMAAQAVPTDQPMAGWDEFLRAAINDPKGSEPARHTLANVILKPRISDDAGEADDETADAEERRNEPTVDPKLREAAYEWMREATRARDKKEFAAAISLAKRGIAALTALDLAEPTHMATMLLAHLYTVRAHEIANTPAAVLDLLQALKIYAASIDYSSAKAMINNIEKFEAALAAELETSMRFLLDSTLNNKKETEKRRMAFLQLIDEKIAATARNPSMGPVTAGKKSGPRATMSAHPLLQAERLIVGSKPLMAGPAIAEQIVINPLTQDPAKPLQPPSPIDELPDATSDLAPSLVDSSLHPTSSITPCLAARNFAPHAAAVLRFAK